MFRVEKRRKNNVQRTYYLHLVPIILLHWGHKATGGSTELAILKILCTQILGLYFKTLANMEPNQSLFAKFGFSKLATDWKIVKILM